MRTAAIATLFTLAASANAFSVGGLALVSRPIAQSTTARNVLLSQEETDAIIAKADACAEGECSIDDIDNLIADLKEQEKILNNRLVDVMNMVAHLQKVNTHGRDRDEVRAFVQDLLRVFAHEDTKVMPTGFSGDIGKGPTTAYDALDPKPWKAS